MVRRKNPVYRATRVHQRGYGIYRGRALQRGHGLGGIFKGLFRMAAPLLKKAGKKALRTVGKRALKAGANALTDIAEKRATPKQALKSRVKEILVPPPPSPKKGINTRVTKKKPHSVKGKVRRRSSNAPILKQH